ncbi:MAG: GNAT family N-acetyltransferase [Burkholderiaceae bacterium]|nr:GNAT family N-acetyltransferase [Burkholderiaceae bacterium]
MLRHDDLTINALDASALGIFFAYLNDHLGDNGAPGTGYFQPLPRQQSEMPTDKMESFRRGLQSALGEPGWRRLWVAHSADGSIAGHIDLRAHPEAHTGHRCLLGMGVERTHRRQGLGARLLAHAEQWAAEHGLEWIDLKVLAVNEAAISLYRRNGYTCTGESADMFRFDGQAFSYVGMSKRIMPAQPGR